MTTVQEIAGKHLGHKGEYICYDKVDKSLLVAIPRSLSRKESNITVKTDGFDCWNVYEFSCLRKDGVPCSGRLKITYDSNSEFLVESKSLKLYMNSWNFENTGKMNLEELAGVVQKQVQQDLEEVLNTSVQVTMFTQLFDSIEDLDPVCWTGFKDIDKHTLNTPFDHNHVKDSKSYLKSVSQYEHIEGTVQRLFSSNLRSNCRITNQPDWADVFIEIDCALKSVDEKSLLEYILSLRKQSHFHEECAELILNDLYNEFKPNKISVVCLYTRRGGIDICPVRFKGGVPSSHPDFRNSGLTFRKTFRQ